MTTLAPKRRFCACISAFSAYVGISVSLRLQYLVESAYTVAPFAFQVLLSHWVVEAIILLASLLSRLVLFSFRPYFALIFLKYHLISPPAFFIDTNNEWLRPETISRSLNFSGRLGILRWQACDFYLKVPFGILIAIGFSAGLLFSDGAPLFRK